MRLRLVVPIALALVPPATVAAAAVRISRVYVNAPNPDTGSNKTLNGEYVRLRNTGAKARSLKRWTIRDRSSHVNRFGRYRLQPGRTVTVHTGDGSNTARHRYWEQSWHGGTTTAGTGRCCARPTAPRSTAAAGTARSTAT